MNTDLYFYLYGWLNCGIVGMARLTPIFFILPVLNSGVLTGTARNTVIFLLGLGLWPHAPSALPEFGSLYYLSMLLREGMIGVMLGCLFAWPFWVFHALGCMIDNQRGATVSSSIDPVNGIDTSELANFFNLFVGVVYLQGGGMLSLLEVIQRSYQVCDPLQGCELVLPSVLGLITTLVGKALVLASPVIATLLLSEMLLGLLSRFAPQMNAFAVAMTVKSGVAFIIMLLYFRPVFPPAILDLGLKASQLPRWLHTIMP